MDCELRECDWRSHWEMDAGFRPERARRYTLKTRYRESTNGPQSWGPDVSLEFLMRRSLA